MLAPFLEPLPDAARMRATDAWAIDVAASRRSS